MKNFLRRRVPPFRRVLLIESGSRHLLEALIPRLQAEHGERLPIDLVTCYPGEPRGFDSELGRVFRVADYAGRRRRRDLYRELGRRQPTVAVVICSGEPIMTKWKWTLAARLPVKVLILNENGDYFWFDRGHWRVIRQFALYRSGLTGAGVVRTAARLVAFPFTFVYLLLFTAFVHLRRKVHI